jgi:multidrug efflux pump subunit AcrB
MVGKTFLPQDDQNEFEIGVRAPGGFTLAETSRTLGEKDSLTVGSANLLKAVDQISRLKAKQTQPTQGDLATLMNDAAKALPDRRRVDLYSPARQQLRVAPDPQRLPWDKAVIRPYGQGL